MGGGWAHISPEKMMWVPFLRSFPGSEAHKLLLLWAQYQEPTKQTKSKTKNQKQFRETKHFAKLSVGIIQIFTLFGRLFLQNDLRVFLYIFSACLAPNRMGRFGWVAKNMLKKMQSVLRSHKKRGI